MSKQQLLGIVSELHQPFGYERSIKFTQERIYHDRMLLSFARPSNGDMTELSARLLFLGLDKQVISTVEGWSKDISLMHLGYESYGSHQTYKIYGEYADNIQRLWTQDRIGSVSQNTLTVFESYKWLAHSGESIAPCCRYERYCWHPFIALQAMYKLVDQHTVLGDMFRTTVLCLLVRALATTSHRDLMLLSIENENGEIRSLDVNFYELDWKVADVHKELLTMLVALGVEKAEANDRLAQIGHFGLGHVSIGHGADGDPYVTLYFGVMQGSADSLVSLGFQPELSR